MIVINKILSKDENKVDYKNQVGVELALDSEEEKINDKTVKVINAISTNDKIKCPVCNKYTRSVHDYLKPINSKYVKVAEYECYLRIKRKRFICRKCNKRIIEDIGIINKGKSISNALEIKIRKDLLKPCYSLKDIAEINGVSSDKVRNVLLDAMNDYPEYVKTLPDIISFDEFKAEE